MELDFVAVSALIGIALPLAISYLKNIGRTWNTQVVRVFAFALAFGAATIQVGADAGWESLNLSMIVASGGLIYAIAQASFKGLFEGTATEYALAAAFNPEA